MAKKKRSTKKKKANKKKSGRKVSYKGARKKGHDFERWIANELGHIFPEAKRNLEYQADEAMAGKDIAGTGIYDIQAKSLQNYVSIKTIKQVEFKKGRRPVLITKGNKMEPMVVMRFSDWVKMLEEIRGREEFEAYGIQGNPMDAQALCSYEPKQLPEKPAILDASDFV